MIQIFFLPALDFSSKNKKIILLFLVLILSIISSKTSFPQYQEEEVKIVIPADSKIIRIDKKINDWVYSGDNLAIFKNSKGDKINLKSGVSGKLIFWKIELAKEYSSDEIIGIIKIDKVILEKISNRKSIQKLPNFRELFINLYDSTGLSSIIKGNELDFKEGFGRLIMISVGLILLYLGIRQKFEPLLLIPIGFGAVLSNIPIAGLSEPGGILFYVYEIGIATGIFP